MGPCYVLRTEIQLYLCFQIFKCIRFFLQGQEIVAEQSLDLAAKEGHWVILQVAFKRKFLATTQQRNCTFNLMYPEPSGVSVSGGQSH